MMTQAAQSTPQGRGEEMTNKWIFDGGREREDTRVGRGLKARPASLLASLD